MKTLISSPLRLAVQCQKKFLRYFKKGFQDPTYIAWERTYKEDAHERWEETLNQTIFQTLLNKQAFSEIAKRAISIESRTNLLFSFEKMAIRDAVKRKSDAKIFAEGLFQFLHGSRDLKTRFENFVLSLHQLPKIQTRVVTWPVATVFGFIANPREFIFVKPRVTQAAAVAYGFPFMYTSKVIWETYKQVLDFANQIKQDVKSWKPKDKIDLQSFMWVQGSAEYP